MMFQSGRFVSDNVTTDTFDEVPESRITTHGVELTIDVLYEITGACYISDDDYSTDNRSIVEPDKYPHLMRQNEENEDGTQTQIQEFDERREDSEYYNLEPGRYVVRYNEVIQIPEKTIGFVIPRSRMVRTGCMVNTGVWDSGYVGKGETDLVVSNPTVIESDTPISHIVMARAMTMDMYSGSHQNENIEE